MDVTEARASAATRTRGRPRSEAAWQAILEATRTLLEATSVRELTIETIAKQAGVSKSTIYRWWPNKAAIVIDAVEAMVPRTRLSESKSVSAALTEQLVLLVEHYRGPYGRIVKELIAEGQTDLEVLAAFRDRFLLRRRTVARDLIEHGKSTGEFDAALNTDLACDIIYGPVYYRLLVGHLPLDDEFSRALPKQILVALHHPGIYGSSSHL
jgi:AcrR family transcriptional regulator